MKITVYESLPDSARAVRQAVFMDEQGFCNEFDSVDDVAAHIVMFDGDLPVATCRVFWDDEMNSYVLGRLAVVQERRGKNLGSQVVRAAEEYVRQAGGSSLALHAQCRVTEFYKALGFREFGEVGDDEGCPHIWMKKQWENA